MAVKHDLNSEDELLRISSLVLLAALIWLGHTVQKSAALAKRKGPVRLRLRAFVSVRPAPCQLGPDFVIFVRYLYAFSTITLPPRILGILIPLNGAKYL